MKTSISQLPCLHKLLLCLTTFQSKEHVILGFFFHIHLVLCLIFPNGRYNELWSEKKRATKASLQVLTIDLQKSMKINCELLKNLFINVKLTRRIYQSQKKSVLSFKQHSTLHTIEIRLINLSKSRQISLLLMLFHLRVSVSI
jgi:hypothetical protein